MDGVDLTEDWNRLSGLRVEGNNILIDSSALQIDESG